MEPRNLHEERSPRTVRKKADEIGDPSPSDSGQGPPPLDRAFGDDSARERLYSVLVQTRDAAPAAELAERADCHPDTARKYLDWFAQLGIAVRFEGRPTTYERNEAYFEWRYVSELASHHTLEELRSHLESTQERIRVFREQYDADDPSLVDAREAAEDPTSLDEVWSDLATWASVEEELRLHERARQRLTERPSSEAVQG